MAATFACIAGGPLCRLLESAALDAHRLEPSETPFGRSEVLFAVEQPAPGLYLVPRQLPGQGRIGPASFNYRATLYRLKDLGVRYVLSWTGARTITRQLAVGQTVLLDDLIDLTHLRATSFFERRGLGMLRQFPVFCPTLRAVVEEVLAAMKLPYYSGGTAAVTEGPRLETPAEIRLLGSHGADLVTHQFVPEVFLAKELQICLAGAAYVVDFAETGSRYRPFIPGELFGGLTHSSQADRLEVLSRALPEILCKVAARLVTAPKGCQCEQPMAAHIQENGLPEDWHHWFD